MFRQMNASTGCDKRVEAFFDLWGSGIRAAAATAAGKKEEVPYRPGSLNLYNMNNEKNMEGNQMAAITAGMVKELREMTGAGMMDCKKALAATDGDMEKAVEFLREKGLAAASKKAGRIAAEGLVKTLVSEDGKSAAIVEVNSETDFVAKNAQFQGYVADVAAQVLASSAQDMDAFMAEAWAKDASLTVAQELSSQIAVIGENMNIRRFAQVEEQNGFIASYTHMGGKNRIYSKHRYQREANTHKACVSHHIRSLPVKEGRFSRYKINHIPYDIHDCQPADCLQDTDHLVLNHLFSAVLLHTIIS